MFKDYLYNHIPQNAQPNVYNKYTPFTLDENNQRIINDYNIWEEGKKNNVKPDEYFPVQISSVKDLLERNKICEIALLKNIENTINQEKNLENLNKTLEEEMNTKINELKKCHLKLNQLEINLSSKIAQYNYLVGNVKENVNATQEIKEEIKKLNDNFSKNDLMGQSERILKMSTDVENLSDNEKKNYIKEMRKERINNIFDTLGELQSIMANVSNSTQRNLNLMIGMEKEVQRVINKNGIK